MGPLETHTDRHQSTRLWFAHALACLAARWRMYIYIYIFICVWKLSSSQVTETSLLDISRCFQMPIDFLHALIYCWEDQVSSSWARVTEAEGTPNSFGSNVQCSSKGAGKYMHGNMFVQVTIFQKQGGRCQPGGMQRCVRDWVIVFIQYIYLRVGVMPSYWNIPDRCLQTLPDASWVPAGVFNKMTCLIYGFWSAGVGVFDLFTHMLNLFVSGSILT